jgi:precorrin-2 dehydrogenase/sirohydrochlorin ferrochelatase
MLDLGSLPVLLAGNGSRALARLRALDEAGGNDVRIFAPEPTDALTAAAGARLVRRWPTAFDLEGRRILLVADAPDDVARPLAAHARGRDVLVNVEDVRDLCDFHIPAMIRRGDLLVTVSTGGRSPTLARLLRGEIEKRFGPEWSKRLEKLAVLRDQWISDGADRATVARRTEAAVAAEGWLS